ncbi:MAG TPA: SH3 domain-containing protein [Thermomicrobiales bacterium]|nr:SH3 domain-containing protein [Thermomicrobiales bacterium]
MRSSINNPSRPAVWSRLLLLAILLVSSLVIPGVVRPQKAMAASASVTSDLNLRAGPSTSNTIKLVMPAGASVQLLSELGRSGFYKVSYNGELGYAYSDYLAIGGSRDDSVDAGWGNAGSASTTSALNLRMGPGTGYAVADVMPDGATVTLTGAADSGFLGVLYNGANGWASADYLAQSGTDSPSGTAYTTSNLNLRSGPSTANLVLLVLPSGAAVSLTGDEQNGFASISYDGTEGWASQNYLTDSAPVSGGSYTTAEIIQIIYDAAAKYGQNGDAMLAVARCESLLDPDIVNQWSNASGLFQFLPGTWATTPYAGDSIFDPVANAEAAAWMWSVGRRGEWVC